MNPASIRRNSRGISRAVLKWGRLNFQSYPWRDEPNLWLALIAEIMLTRTRASTVVPVWNEFSNRYPRPDDFVADSRDAARELLSPLGLKWRIELITRLAASLSGQPVPSRLAKLRELPAVGEYVAAAHLSLHRNQRAVLVDANVVRWICRLTGMVPGPEVRRKKWLTRLADQLTPKSAFRDYNYGVLDLSMTVCTTKPLCEQCPVLRFCEHGTRRYRESQGL